MVIEPFQIHKKKSVVASFVMEELISEGFSLFDLFSCACFAGRVELGMLVIEKGVYIEDGFMFGGQKGLCLHAACQIGNNLIVEMLLDFDVDVNAKDECFTALLWAVMKDQTEITNLLLSEGTEINPYKDDIIYPLASLCVKGKLPLARLLLERGADPNGGTFPTLHFINDKSCLPLAELLLAYGADINLVDKSHCHYTALHLAAKNDDELVKFLLRNGADPTIKDGKGKSPMHYAVDRKVMWVLFRHSWFGNIKRDNERGEQAWSCVSS